MALRNYLSQRFFNWHAFAVQMDAQVSIGATGAPTLVSSSAFGSIPTSRGIKSITRMTTGIYQVQLDDNFAQLLDYKAQFTAGLTGSALLTTTAGAQLSIGTVYQIVTVGTTTQGNWVTMGLPAGITAAVGQVFKAATTGTGTGSGTVKAIAANSAGRIELMTSPNGADSMLNSQPFTQGLGGGYITFQCLAAAPTGTAAFTGSALGTHTHSFTPAGTNANDGPPETFTGTPGTTGATSAGTPAGTIAVTGTAPIATDPTNGSTMYLKFLLSNSKVG